MRRMILIVAVLFALTDVPAVQQPPAPVSFEVASIRQNISGLADSSLNTPPTGVVTGTNIQPPGTRPAPSLKLSREAVTFTTGC